MLFFTIAFQKIVKIYSLEQTSLGKFEFRIPHTWAHFKNYTLNIDSRCYTKVPIDLDLLTPLPHLTFHFPTKDVWVLHKIGQ